MLCERVLRYCNSPVAGVRRKAVTFLYFLMRQNNQDKATPGFSRIKVSVCK